jgi:Fe(3+) dicitrate transport protein
LIIRAGNSIFLSLSIISLNKSCSKDRFVLNYIRSDEKRRRLTNNQHSKHSLFTLMTAILLLLLSTLILADLPQISSSDKQTQQITTVDPPALNRSAAIAYDTVYTSIPQIEVVGIQDRFVRIPGSADIIGRAQIQAIAPVSSNEVFRRISGLHVVEEEGVGLRANIGIRGLDPDKSRTVLMLEDGIPIALAPYGEPEMYYTPSMDRMVGVEVIKGSGSILFGPQTFGGVINYLTANPPVVPTTTAQVRGGEGGYFTGRFGYGSTVGNTGFQATYLHKRGDNVGLLEYGLHDFNSKIKLVLAPNSVIGVKLGFYNEQSNSTYIGLTQTMYDTGLFDFTHVSPNDLLNIRRYSASVTHDYFFNNNARLKTTAFGYTTTRNWSRQDFDNTFNPSRVYDRIVGDPETPFGAIFFRNTTGNRNRQFEVLGIEPRFSLNSELGGFRNELDAGIRYLYERAFEQRIDGTPERPTSGLLRDDEIRTGRAVSAFVQTRIFFTDDLTFTPGLRVEYFNYERDILRNANQQLSVANSSSITEFIPGAGLNYRLDANSAAYIGVHRGFGPPRTKDAITTAGVAEDLQAERSWNFETGVRGGLNAYLSGEITAFFLIFSNQIIPVSESSGGVGTGLSGLINGGETEHLGLESVIEADLGGLLNLPFGLVLRNASTYTSAVFSSDRYVNIGGGQTENVKGNTLPYAPELLVNSRLDLNMPFGLYVGIDGTYISRQFGDIRNTLAGSGNGRQGQIPAYYVLNATVSYPLALIPGSSVSLAVKNLLDERYIVSRRPQGIRAGLPRFVTAGIDLNF